MTPTLIPFATLCIGFAAGYLLGCERLANMRAQRDLAERERDQAVRGRLLAFDRGAVHDLPRQAQR